MGRSKAIGQAVRQVVSQMVRQAVRKAVRRAVRKVVMKEVSQVISVEEGFLAVSKLAFVAKGLLFESRVFIMDCC